MVLPMGGRGKIGGVEWVGEALVPGFVQGFPGEALALHRVGEINECIHNK